MNAMIIYWTAGGNTEKVALAIREGLQESGATVSLRKVQDAADVDFDAYDLVCVGFPSYQWSPPQPMDRFLKDKFEEYRKQGCRFAGRCPLVMDVCRREVPADLDVDGVLVKCHLYG